MAFYLPVSSFPDFVPSHDSPPLDLNVRIVIAPPSSKKRRPRLGNMFGKDGSTPKNAAGADTEATDPTQTAEPSKFGAYPGQHEAALVTPVIAQSIHSHIADEPSHHNPHHRSVSEDWSRHSPSGMDMFTEYRAPRSTKESIATLGLLLRTPSPDSPTRSDSNSMVACCTNGWVEPQALPPLPPLPPSTPPQFQPHNINPPSRSSSLGHDVKETFEIIASEGNDEADGQDLEVNLELSSAPPSPITFSHRNSAYITVESSSGLKTLNERTITTISLDSGADIRRRATSCSSSPKRRETAPPTVSSDMMGHPWIRINPVTPSSLFVSSPKLLKPGQTYQPPSASASCKFSAKLPSWKFFRRSVSANDKEEADSITDRTRPQTRCSSRRDKRHRNSIHVASIASVQSETSSPRRSSIGSDRTLSTMRMYDRDSDTATLGPGLSERKSMNTLRSATTTHRVEGDIWQEEEIGAVIDTLRTMKAGKFK